MVQFLFNSNGLSTKCNAAYCYHRYVTVQQLSVQSLRQVNINLEQLPMCRNKQLTISSRNYGDIVRMYYFEILRK